LRRNGGVAERFFSHKKRKETPTLRGRGIPLRGLASIVQPDFQAHWRQRPERRGCSFNKRHPDGQCRNRERHDGEYDSEVFERVPDGLYLYADRAAAVEGAVVVFMPRVGDDERLRDENGGGEAQQERKRGDTPRRFAQCGDFL
jgi:hypothetical protein